LKSIALIFTSVAATTSKFLACSDV